MTGKNRVRVQSDQMEVWCGTLDAVYARKAGLREACRGGTFSILGLGAMRKIPQEMRRIE